MPRGPVNWRPAAKRREPRLILEIAHLQVKAGQGPEFETVFGRAEGIIAAMPGYLGHELQKCLERPDHYMLLVRWASVAHHEIGFRGSPEYQTWRGLLHHFYDPFPTVLHYQQIAGPGLAPAVS